MGIVVTVMNMKGGVGKTTTAVNIAASIAISEFRTLLIDIDPQANATSGFGLETGDEIENTFYNVMLNGGEIRDAAASGRGEAGGEHVVGRDRPQRDGGVDAPRAGGGGARHARAVRAHRLLLRRRRRGARHSHLESHGHAARQLGQGPGGALGCGCWGRKVKVGGDAVPRTILPTGMGDVSSP